VSEERALALGLLVAGGRLSACPASHSPHGGAHGKRNGPSDGTVEFFDQLAPATGASHGRGGRLAFSSELLGEKVYAFIDEYGDTKAELGKPGTSKVFAIAALLVRDDDVDGARAAAEALRRKFFQTGEIKSAKVGGNDDRRLAILEHVSRLPVATFVLVINKGAIFPDSGLSFKRTFFKYTNARLYEWIHRRFENVSVVADEHGGREFMEEFERYIDRKLPRTLFSRRTFEFRSSRADPLLQVADFIVGTTGRVWDPDKPAKRKDDMLRLVAECSVGVETWPPQVTPKPSRDFECIGSDFDHLVGKHCLRQAALFLEEHVEDEIEATAILQHIVFHTNVREREFVHGAEIREALARQGIMMDERQFQTEVARLRDHNVILSSGPHGYRLPTRASDLVPFLDHAQSIVVPMLARVSRAREDLRASSLGALDILDHPDFAQLRSLLQNDV
jgi:hypothetical protein